ncbi:ferrous iron transport protein A [Azospirillum lipoferum]|uniref:FeoA family protein n=1 Tax=Azospirillum TaxID=191 RepID=UPI001B3C1222|nr:MULTISPECIES: FeoA family protein [Azospirillum]MCP1611868.1 ferrous iron transport protein A [Azospirillum lipoferum]MDW5533373.1 FeoA family protein [Azospirillum sp. NL1]
MIPPLSGSARDAASSPAPHRTPGPPPALAPGSSADPPSRAGKGCRLGALHKGERAVVTGLDESAVATPLPPGELERRMIEMGLIEGARVEILHEGFPGADPLAVRINDHTLALRRAEAHAVLVTLG